MRKNILLLLATAILFTGVISCSDDKENFYDFSLKLDTPTGLNDASLSNLIITFNDVNTGNTIVEENYNGNILGLHIPQGLYNITIEGDIRYMLGEDYTTAKIKGYKEAVYVTNNQLDANISLFLSLTKKDFVISEIFFVGTETPEGKSYTGDQYIKIYNNSDEVLYADGLAIVESAYTSSTKREYTPNILSEAFPIQVIYKIPGNGTDYPIKPGEELLIVDQAIDHRTANPNSFDFRNADFEWYDDHRLDIDNENVTNLEKLYSYSASVWIMHKRGFHSYAIVRLPVDNTTFLTEQTFHYEYIASNDRVMSFDRYKIPNSWIVDAVNLSVEAVFEWIVIDPSLDMGWTYCGKIDMDASRYGKSVRRKVAAINPDGRKILQDTNNSTVDFEPEAVPSVK